MSETERLRALLADSTARPWRSVVGADALVVRPDKSYMNIGDAIYHPEYVVDAALIAAAVNALPALLDVVEAARAYLACDGSGIRAPEPWTAPFDAMDLGEALPALRAALARLDGAS